MNTCKLMLVFLISAALWIHSPSAVAQVIGSERLCNDPVVDAYYYADGHTEWDVPARGETYRRMQLVPYTPTNPEPAPTSQQTARGYIAFVPKGRVGVLPEYRPAASEITESASIFASPGEYEPATFAIRPLSNLGTITFVCSNFTGPAGAIIGSSSVDTYAVAPTAEPTGSATDPTDPNGNQAYWVPKWLQPTNMAQATAYKNIQVYLDVHVPAGQTPGTYSGSVAVQVGGVTRSYFTVQLEVKPVDLELPLPWGFFQYDWTNVITRGSTIMGELNEMRRNGMTQCIISPLEYQNHPVVYSDGSINCWMYDQSIDLYKEAGFENPPVVAMEALMYFIFHAKGWDVSPYTFTDIYIPNFTAASVDSTKRAFAGQVLLNLYNHSIGNHTNCNASAWCKTHAVLWPAGTYFYFADEAGYTDPWNGNMEKAKLMYGAARQYAPSMKTACTAYTVPDWQTLNETDSNKRLNLDITRWDNPCQTAYHDGLINYRNGQNAKLFGLDWIPAEDTYWGARHMTFTCEKAGLDGIMNWAQWLWLPLTGEGAPTWIRPFNPYIWLPNTSKNGPFFITDENSILWRSLPWIGMREGIDDSRYVQTVRKLIADATAAGATTAANNAQTTLNNVLNEVHWVNDPRASSTWTAAIADTERLALANVCVDLTNAMSAFYVNKNAPGPTHNGLSWATAYLTVQEGINAASAGHQVWVAAGTYVERITLKANVSIYGGFAGTETKRSQRIPFANVTIVDGSAGGSVVTVPSGVMGNTAIDGFTIRNGIAVRGAGIYCASAWPTITNNIITGNATTGSPGIGGGIYIYQASPKMCNNVIASNSAKYGGGVYCYGSSAVITSNTIVANTGTTNGGGIYCDASSPTIANNIVASGNSGIYANGGVPVLGNNCVYGNTAYNYSGLAAGAGDISADPLFVNAANGDFHLQATSQCIDAGYDSWAESGGVDMDGEARVHGAHVDIGADEVHYALVIYVDEDAPGPTHDGQTWRTAYLTVQQGLNAATSTPNEIWVASGTYTERITLQDGVALYGGFSRAETSRNQRDFKVNVTVLDGGAGGSVVSAPTGVTATAVIDGFTIRNGMASRGAGIYCYSTSSPTISNNTITANTATGTAIGGGVYCYSASPNIVNNLIASNSAKYGGGIYCYNSAPVITSNTIASNTGTTNGGGIYCDTSSPAIANNILAFGSSGIYRTGGTPVLKNNCVYGNTSYNYSGLSAGIGDISADPLFVDRPAGDYHIQAASLCIDAGDDVSVLSGWLDMDCQARIAGAHVDIGVDEAVYSIVTGKIILQDYVGNVTQAPVTIALRKEGGGVTMRTVNLDVDGSYFVSGLDPGTYDVAVKASHWLQKVVANVLVGPFDLGTISLINGDVNGDNAITSADLGILIPNLDETSVLGDLDCDNIVTTADLSVVLKNFGQAGDP